MLHYRRFHVGVFPYISMRAGYPDVVSDGCIFTARGVSKRVLLIPTLYITWRFSGRRSQLSGNIRPTSYQTLLMYSFFLATGVFRDAANALAQIANHDAVVCNCRRRHPGEGFRSSPFSVSILAGGRPADPVSFLILQHCQLPSLDQAAGR